MSAVLILLLINIVLFTVMRVTVFKDYTNKEYAMYTLMVLGASLIIAVVQKLGE